jgi:hypothetical protein
MEWTQFVIFCGGVFGLFFWNRSESRADVRHMDAKLESTRNLVQAIHDEMKDFHTKLARQDLEFKNHMKYHHKD